MAIALGLKMKMGSVTALIASVVTTGLQAWHKFTATTWSGSNRLPDSSPVATNTAALFTGRGLSFDGVNDFVDMANPAISCKSLVFYVNPDTAMQSILQLTATASVSTVAGVLTATGWASPTRYVNGVAATTVSNSTWQQVAITSATGITVNDLELGRIAATYFSGKMSNVRIFSTELTAGQVAEMYANPEQALPTGSVAADLVGWWPMTEGTGAGVYPAGSAKFYGAISGATWITAQTGNVMQPAIMPISTPLAFDGTDDYVSALDPDFQAADFTISFWVMPINRTTQYIIDKISVLVIIDASNGTVAFGNGSGLVHSTTALTLGNLTHVTVTHDTSLAGFSRYKIYFNGGSQSVTLDGTYLQPTVNNTVIQICRRSNNSSFLNGTLRDLAIWSSLLTPTQITNLTAGTSPLSTGSPLAFWKNSGLSGWTDLTGNGYNGTVNGSPTVMVLPTGTTSGYDIMGFPIQQSNTGQLILNGAGYASITDAATLDITSAITLESWIKPFTVTAAQTILGKTGSYALGITSAGKPVFTKWTSTTPTATATTATALTANTWYHIAATYDGTNVKIYINGTLNTTTAVSGAIDATAANVLLGALTTSTELFNGYIDSAKVYAAANTAANVLMNYAAEAAEYA